MSDEAVVGKITPQDLQDRVGSAQATVSMSEAKDKVPGITQDPVLILAKRMGQQRDSMIGALLGAYLSMTEYDPMEVELIQRVTDDGMGFRFRPRDLQAPEKLWVLCARHEIDGKEMFGVVQVYGPGVSEKAAQAAAQGIEAQLVESGKKATVWPMLVDFRGFCEDLMIKGDSVLGEVPKHRTEVQGEWPDAPDIGDNDSWTGPDSEGESSEH